MSKPDVVFLVGGRGSRLQGVVNDRPKPMAIVGGSPFLEWLVLLYRTQGVRRFVFCTGYMGEVIQSYFGDGHKWGIEIVYSHESVPLGTGGAIKKAVDSVRSDPFLVVNGDSYCQVQINHLEETHKAHQASATLVVVPVDDCSRYGEVKIDKNGIVKAFSYGKSSEKRPGMISSGIYMFQKEALNAFPSGVNLSVETDIFPALVGKGLSAVIDSGNFLDIGTPQSYMLAWRLLKKDLHKLNSSEFIE
jgi:NDP-sugar pyrophosphorylase family protein